MAQQQINYGNPPDGSGGDNRRAALEKLEANDTELYAAVAAAQATANSGLIASFRNKLINGNFDFWQRGTNFTAVGYTADRWYWNNSLVTSIVLQQGVFPVGDANALAAGSTNYLAIGNAGNTDATNHYNNLIQKIEGVRTLAGKTVTLSFKAYSATARNIAVEFTQYFGTTGTAQTTGIGAQQVALVAGWNAISLTVALPSIAGKTIAGGNDVLGVVFWASAGTAYNARTANLGARSGTVYLSAVQLEEGSAATPFEQRPPGVELALCQRYFEKSFDTIVTPGNLSALALAAPAVAYSAAACRSCTLYKVSKRAAPTLTIYSSNNIAGAANGVWQVYVGGTWVNPPNVSVSQIALTGFNLDCNFGSGLSANAVYLAAGHWAADAEL